MGGGGNGGGVVSGPDNSAVPDGGSGSATSLTNVFNANGGAGGVGVVNGTGSAGSAGSVSPGSNASSTNHNGFLVNGGKGAPQNNSRPDRAPLGNSAALPGEAGLPGGLVIFENV